MSDYRAMFDRDYIGAWDLKGRDVTVTIASVKAGELVGEKGRKAKKPIIRFERTDKAFAANKTNCKTIAAMYGNDTRKWVGRRITMYATETEFGGNTVECIRVRPQVPADANSSVGGKQSKNGAEPAAAPESTLHDEDGVVPDALNPDPEQESPPHD